MSVYIVTLAPHSARALEDELQRTPGKTAEMVIADAVDAHLQRRQDVRERLGEEHFLFDQRNHAR